jgi:DNA-binding NtrC family response regulator
MGAETIEGLNFRDDDMFLLKFLPGNDEYSRNLRERVFTLNTPSNLQLVRFVTVIGATGTGKNYLVRVCAGHRQWQRFKNSEDLIEPGRSYPDGIGPLSLYTEKLGEQMLTALPDSLAESLLFGHVRGAFSDARKDYAGLFRDEGYEDILLDEIGDASATIQAKLLAVLEGRPFIPVGGTSRERARCEKRIFMATNRDLKKLIAEKIFREDLFYRVRRHTVAIRSLAENKEAIPSIASVIVDRLCPEDLRRLGPPEISSSDLNWLKKQPWPGNVRELEEVIELWLASGGVRPIEELARYRHFATETPSALPERDWNSEVRNRIDEILRGHRKPKPTLKEFVEEFTLESKNAVTAAIHAWYQETKPTPEMLRKLFPNMQLNSIRTLMSRVGKGK